MTTPLEISPSEPAIPTEQVANRADARAGEVEAQVQVSIPRWLLWPLALAPILLAVLQLGRWHPDEVYQYLEPAFFRVNDYGIRAWEWQVGLRNWSVPLIFAACLKVAQQLGVDHPRVYRAFIALPQLLLHAAMLLAVWRYMAHRLMRTGAGWSACAFALVAAYAPVLLFAGRTMGESISAAFLVIAVERLDRSDLSARTAGLWGGAMLGLSVVARYGSAVFVLAALVWLLATRQWRVLLWTCLSGIAVALALGALDWATWGKPFHSLIEYTKFNVLSGEAARRFGASPAWYYLPVLGMWIAAWAWPGLIASTWREKRVPLAAVMAVAYLGAISATEHKEDRFIYPAIVLFALAAAPGAVWLIQRVRSALWRAAAIALALCAGSTMWLYAPEFRGDQFRAQVVATRPADVTGLLIVGEGLWGSGGHFYMGKNIPMYNADLAPHIQQVLRRDARVNRVITFDGLNVKAIEAEGFVRIDQIGRETILARKR